MYIEIRKIGRYDPTQGGRYERYEGYCLSTDESIDLPLDKPQAIHELDVITTEFKANWILSSSRLRACQTAEYFGQRFNIGYQTAHSLREVPFDLSTMMSKEEFLKNGSDLVRKRFVEGFVSNTLLEPRESIKTRLELLFEEIRGNQSSRGMLISHSFIMKIIEGIASGIDIFGQPDSLAQLIDPSKKTYPFGGGFSFEI
jgi:broad specificity phosphatase PhoE